MSAPSPTDVILIVCGEPADQSPEHLARIHDTVTDAKVELVAPALAIPGERWIVDLDARASHARSRLQRWSAMLAHHAVAIASEVGDPDPCTAAGDARRELPTAQIIHAPAGVAEGSATPDRLMRLIERYGRMPVPVVTGR